MNGSKSDPVPCMVQEAYQSVVALCTLLQHGGDAPIPAVQMWQLLKPTLKLLEKATED